MSFTPPYLPRIGEPDPRPAGAVVVRSLTDQQLSPMQRGELSYRFELHKLALSASKLDYLSRHGQLADGTLYQIISNGPQHVINAWPRAAGRRAFELLPAFWLDAPTAGEPNPDPLNSGTWLSAPPDPALPPKITEHARKMHPGNQTWRDPRPDSKVRGLVLSWWGLSKDRYGTSGVTPEDWYNVSPEGYRPLYCNGVKVADAPGMSVYGASITEIEGEQVVCLLTVDIANMSDFVNPHQLLAYGGTDFGGFFAPDASLSRDMVVTLWHAKVPAAMRFDFIMGPLDFTYVTEVAISLFGTTMEGAGDTWWFQNRPRGPVQACARCSPDGAHALLPIAGVVTIPPDTDGSTGQHLAGYIEVDMRDGTLTTGVDLPGELTSLIVPAGIDTYFAALFTDPLVQLRGWRAWRDYRDSDGALVSAVIGTIGVEDNLLYAGSATHYRWFWITDLGVVHYEEEPNPGTFTVWETLVGDARVGLYHFVDRDSTTRTRVTVRAGADTEVVELPTDVGEEIQLETGYEGGDSSFDGRLIVTRTEAATRIFLDGVEKTTEFAAADDNFNLIKYPVLCGPLARMTGTPQPAKQYVQGNPP